MSSNAVDPMVLFGFLVFGGGIWFWGRFLLWLVTLGEWPGRYEPPPPPPPPLPVSWTPTLVWLGILVGVIAVAWVLGSLGLLR